MNSPETLSLPRIDRNRAKTCPVNASQNIAANNVATEVLLPESPADYVASSHNQLTSQKSRLRKQKAVRSSRLLAIDHNCPTYQ